MGEVYRAWDLRLERSVAIKVLRADRSLSPTLGARFEQEAKSVSALQHPNICVIHDISSQDGVDFMVMEYVAGKTLNNVIPPHGLPTDVALKYAAQIADALACAHRAGIIHRDVIISLRTSWSTTAAILKYWTSVSLNLFLKLPR